MNVFAYDCIKIFLLFLARAGDWSTVIHMKQHGFFYGYFSMI